MEKKCNSGEGYENPVNHEYPTEGGGQVDKSMFDDDQEVTGMKRGY